MSRDRLDAHAKPPDSIRQEYKRYQKLHATSLECQPDLIDSASASSNGLLSKPKPLPHDLRDIFGEYLGTNSVFPEPASQSLSSAYEFKHLPGLYLYPNLIDPSAQLHLLDTLLVRDLVNPNHRTNVHVHYDVPYPAEQNGICPSYFDTPSMVFEPRDPSTHKPITGRQYLDKKLRWMTLGGQYDWTNKIYPEGEPPAFPLDTKRMIERLFPMKAEAAIANLYTSGDTLSLHRDVSEECDRPLASISLGCDAIFVVGLDNETVEEPCRIATIRLRSGDALLMCGQSRYAWHGVPKVLADTCPEWMQNWPYRELRNGTELYKGWKGWMQKKRVNLNVRQMFDIAG